MDEEKPNSWEVIICRSKKVFGCVENAQQTADHWRKLHGKRMWLKPYHCPVCSRYHLTKVKKAAQRNAGV